MIPNLATPDHTAHRPRPALPRDVVPNPLPSRPPHASGTEAETPSTGALTDAYIARCIDRRGEYLYLGNLGLTSLPPEIWQMRQLRQLHIGGNFLNKIPAEIGLLSELTHLTASGSGLTEISGALGDLHRLEILDLSDNGLTSLPLELGNLRSLRYLYVQGNPFHALPSVIAALPETCSVLISPPKDGIKLRHGQPLHSHQGAARGPFILRDDNTDRVWPHPRFLA